MLQIYGIEHIIYLLVSIILMAVGFFLIKKYINTEKKLNLLIRLLGLLLLINVIWNRISISLEEERFFSNFLPESYCGITSILLSISVMIFKKNSKIFHCLIYVGMVGALLTFFYPDFIPHFDNFFDSRLISGLNHHTIMIFLVLVMVLSGYVKPDLKKWYYLFIGLAFYICYGLFLITILDYPDALYIFNAMHKDVPLKWIHLGILFLPLHLSLLSIWEVLLKKRPKILILKPMDKSI